MAPRTALDPNELVEVAFIDLNGNRHPKVKLPRALIHSASQRAKQNWLIQDGQIPDPSAPPLPDPVEVIVDEVAADRQAAANTAVDQLRAQLDELQGRLSGQPLSIEELVAFKRELSGYMTQAAMAAAQLAVVEGTGSKIRADLVAIATPLSEQAAVTAEQQAEVATVQQRVLADLQAQAAALLEALSQDVAGALSEAEQQALTTAQTVARSEAARVAREVAGTFYPASSTIAPEDPRTTDARSWCLKHWGIDRDYIQGDSVLLTRESGVIPLIYKGPSLGWIEGAELEPRVITATGPQILDQSVKNEFQITNDIKFPSGGSGGGSVPILETEVYVGTPQWVPLFRAWDSIIPSKYWGGRKGTQGYEDDEASWEPLESTIFSWRIVAMLNDPADPATAVSATFTILRQGNGALSLAPHDSIASGAFYNQGTVGVSDVKIDELNRNFSTESGLKAGWVTGEEVSLMFADWNLTPRRMLISGHAMPIRRRRTDNP